MAYNKGKNTKDHNERKSGGKKLAKDQRRVEAIERNEKWQSLTLAQKLESLKNRPGKCAKQIAKLTK